VARAKQPLDDTRMGGVVNERLTGGIDRNPKIAAKQCRNP
jgi:hypothetical protein